MTIKDIARELGLSPSTVSRALNNHPAINQNTKKLVLDFVELHNYTPNQNARNLVNQKSHTIGFMIPDISDSFFSHAAFGVEEVLYKNNYEIAYSSTERKIERVRDFLIRAKEHRYSGVFITPDFWDQELIALINKIDIPIVSLRRKTPRVGLNIPYVDSDHYGGIRSAVDYLVSLGHKNIGMISADTIIEKERSTAYRDAMTKHNLQHCIFDKVSTKFASDRLARGHKAAKLMLEQNPQLTALIASDDMMAIGVLEYLHSIGKSAPEHLSVIGCDDRPEGRLFPLQLTTIQQALHEIGKQAAMMIIQLIQNPSKQPASIALKTNLLPRKTTAPPRSL